MIGLTAGMNRWLTIGTALTVLLVAGCQEPYNPGPTVRDWTEDVRMDDGSTITVKRHAEFKESNSIGGDAYRAIESVSTLSFTGELATLPSWSAPLIAQVLYRDPSTMEWVVVAITNDCYVWARRGAPDPPYWEFRLNEQGWREGSLSESSIGRRANLLRGYRNPPPPVHVTVDDKQSIDRDIKRLDQMTMAERMYRIVIGDKEPFICQQIRRPVSFETTSRKGT